jgi:ABC-type multidrug transport system fused ATPase/permease subunit
MIAHRLSTLDRCDVLLKIDGGRLVEVSARHAGSGQELYTAAPGPGAL